MWRLLWGRSLDQVGSFSWCQSNDQESRVFHGTAVRGITATLCANRYLFAHVAVPRQELTGRVCSCEEIDALLRSRETDFVEQQYSIIKVPLITGSMQLHSQQVLR